MEAAGVALGAVSLFFQTYDNCRRLYDSLEELRHFGKDLRMSCARLRAIQWDLDALMEIRTTALRNPPDLDNQNHPVTKQILLHLTIILTYFTNCTKILEATYKDSGVVFPGGDGFGEPSAASSRLPSLISGTSDGGSSHTVLTSTDSQPSPHQSPQSRLRKMFDKISLNRSSKSGPSQHLLIPPQLTGEFVTPAESQLIVSRGTSLRHSALTVGGTVVNPFSLHDDESSLARANVSLWALVKWTDHNKRDLDTAIHRLGDSVGAFRQYLELRGLHRPGQMLALESPVRHLEYDSRMPPAAISKLHNALKSINQSPKEAATFALSIAESCESNRRAIEDIPFFQDSLNPDGKIFFLQKDEAEEQSTFIAIEQVEGPLIDTSTSHTRTAKDIRHSEQPHMDASYMLHGVVEGSGSHPGQHRIFVQTQAWRVYKSFSQYLDEESTLQLLTPLAVVDIFRTILTAYLDLEQVRHSCQYPRLEDYKTYLHPDHEGDQSVVEPPPHTNWQMPYWSCGFGKSLPRRIPGAAREGREPDEAVVRLGLVLFQLGSGSKAILTPGPSGAIKPWRNLKLEALNRFEDVSQRCGIVLANIVQECLFANAQTERAAICGCLQSLENLQVELCR